MKQSHSCPKCGCRKLLYIAEVADRYDRSPSSNGVAMIARTKKGKLGGYAAGELEAYVCSACGYCEQYVKDLASLSPDGETIQEIGG